MAKFAFAFELKARVLVPGMSGVQGLICARAESVIAEPAYRVHYVTNSGNGEVWFDQSEMLAANPPITEGDAIVPRALPPAKKKNGKKKR